MVELKELSTDSEGLKELISDRPTRKKQVPILLETTLWLHVLR